MMTTSPLRRMVMDVRGSVPAGVVFGEDHVETARQRPGARRRVLRLLRNQDDVEVSCDSTAGHARDHERAAVAVPVVGQVPRRRLGNRSVVIDGTDGSLSVTASDGVGAGTGACAAEDGQGETWIALAAGGTDDEDVAAASGGLGAVLRAGVALARVGPSKRSEVLAGTRLKRVPARREPDDARQQRSDSTPEQRHSHYRGSDLDDGNEVTP